MDKKDKKRLEIYRYPQLGDKLKEHGFKKNGVWFRRKCKEVIQGVSFIHANFGVPHTRFYAPSVFLEFPDIIAQAEEFLSKYEISDSYWGWTAQDLINLMPKKDWCLDRWKVSMDYSDERIAEIADDAWKCIEKYGLPTLNKYSTLEAYSEGWLDGSFKRENNRGYDFLLPPMLIELSRKEEAMEVMEECLKKRYDYMTSKERIQAKVDEKCADEALVNKPTFEQYYELAKGAYVHYKKFYEYLSEFAETYVPQALREKQA